MLQDVTPSVVEDTVPVQSRRQAPQRPCVFCGVMQSKLKRHMVRKHPDEEGVQRMLAAPKENQDNIMDRLRKEGILNENKKRIQIENAELIREHRKGDGETAMCGNCYGFYSKLKIWLHKQQCSKTTNEPIRSLPVSSLVVSEETEDPFTKEYEEQVVNCFHTDAIGEICRTDAVLRQLGKSFYAKGKDRKVAMADMRRFGALLINFRQYTKDPTHDCETMMMPAYFSKLEMAINHTTKEQNGVEKHGQRLAIGYLLKRSALLLKATFIMANNKEKADLTDNFITVLTLRWPYMFNHCQREVELRRQNVLRRPQELPLERDVGVVMRHNVTSIRDIVERTDALIQSDYLKLRSLLVARITLFNGRRGGETCKLTLKQWQEAEDDAWLNPHDVASLSGETRALKDKLKVTYVIGKNRKPVPIVFPVDTVEGMRTLVKARHTCDIVATNQFVFANTGQSTTHVGGWPCVREVCMDAGVTRPDLINATRFRHRTSTLHAKTGAGEAERRIFCKHMGHSQEINENVYQSPQALEEIIQVGKYLLQIDEAAMAGVEEAEHNGGPIVLRRVDDEPQASTSEQNSSQTFNVRVVAEEDEDEEGLYRWEPPTSDLDEDSESDKKIAKGQSQMFLCCYKSITIHRPRS